MTRLAAALWFVALAGCAAPDHGDGAFTVSILDPTGIRGTIMYLSGTAAVRPNEHECVEIVLEADTGAVLEVADACPLEPSGFPNAGSFVLNELTRNPHGVTLQIGRDLYASVGGTLDLEAVSRRRARGQFEATVARVQALEPDSVAFADTLTITGLFDAAVTP
ncbi:hypothetical protein [Rubrivirga sp.]|uniref:hypothetical protein n=1 Tax=Rubrivirga sp. TaxID=1885344 RepID=UPI003C7484F7